MLQHRRCERSHASMPRRRSSMQPSDSPVLPALECRALNKTYGPKRVVLDHLDFALGACEFVAIMGDSGVGKSTILNLITALDQADSVDVLIDGLPVSSLDDEAAT